MDAEIITFLQKCNIPLDSETQLDGLLIPRDILLSMETYHNVKYHITSFKQKFSSSALTSLQKNAHKTQKWPLLNLVRQIMKVCNYQMNPVRHSYGYSPQGHKIFKRFFIIHKYQHNIPRSEHAVV